MNTMKLDYRVKVKIKTTRFLGPVSSRIVWYLNHTPGASVFDIYTDLGSTRQAIRSRLRDLKDIGIVRSENVRTDDGACDQYNKYFVCPEKIVEIFNERQVK